MTLITTHDWAVFLTGAITCNQDARRVSKACPNTVSFLEHIAKKFAEVVDTPCPSDVNAALGTSLIHLIHKHDLRATESAYYPKSLPTFPETAKYISAYLKTLL